MIYTTNFLNISLSILSIFMGFKIMWTQELPMGIRGSGEVFIGNFAYMLGSIFILFGGYALYYTLYI